MTTTNVPLYTHRERNEVQTFPTAYAIFQKVIVIVVAVVDKNTTGYNCPSGGRMVMVVSSTTTLVTQWSHCRRWLQAPHCLTLILRV